MDWDKEFIRNARYYKFPSKTKIKRMTNRIRKKYHIFEHGYPLAEVVFTVDGNAQEIINTDEFFDLYCNTVEPLNLCGTYIQRNEPELDQDDVRDNQICLLLECWKYCVDSKDICTRLIELKSNIDHLKRTPFGPLHFKEVFFRDAYFEDRTYMMEKA